MTVNKTIAVYRFDDYENDYKHIFCGGASLYNAFKSAATDKGMVYDGILKIRIPTNERLDIRLGDYLIFGNVPFSRENAFKIIDVSENRRGLNPHYRIGAK